MLPSSRAALSVVLSLVALVAGCGDATEVELPAISGMRLAAVADPHGFDESPPVPCARLGSEIQLAAHVRAGPAGYSAFEPILLRDAWCSADDCSVTPDPTGWLVPRVTVTSQSAGRVEVEATITVAGISERARSPVEFRVGACPQESK